MTSAERLESTSRGSSPLYGLAHAVGEKTVIVRCWMVPWCYTMVDEIGSSKPRFSLSSGLASAHGMVPGIQEGRRNATTGPLPLAIVQPCNKEGINYVLRSQGGSSYTYMVQTRLLASSVVNVRRDCRMSEGFQQRGFFPVIHSVNIMMNETFLDLSSLTASACSSMLIQRRGTWRREGVVQDKGMQCIVVVHLSRSLHGDHRDEYVGYCSCGVAIPH